MNIYAIFALINAFTSAIVTTLVISHARKRPGALAFGIFSGCATAWSAAYVAWQLAASPETALLWVKILMAPAILLPCALLEFATDYVGPPRRWLVRLCYGAGLTLALFDATPLLVASVVPRLRFSYWPVPGPAFVPFLIAWTLLFAYASLLLARAVRTHGGFERRQILVVLAGIVVGLVGGLTNFPLWFGIPLPPIGNALVSVYVLAVAYAIWREHLFNIRIIAVDVVVFLLWTIFLGRIVVGDGAHGALLDWGLFAVVVCLGLFLIQQVIGRVEQQAELERLLSARKEFLDIAAHQLRSPVTAIVGASSLLAEGIGTTTDVRDNLIHGIFEKSRQLQLLINDLLDASAVEGSAPFQLGKLKTVDLGALVKTIADDLRPKARAKGLAFNLEIQLGRISVLGAADRLEQAIRNLLENAIRYTERGSVAAHLTSNTRAVQLEVVDTGIGVPADFMPHLFERFARAPNARELHEDGSGLGLFIAKRIVEAHPGGELAVTSGPTGSRFSMRLRASA